VDAKDLELLGLGLGGDLLFFFFVFADDEGL
jgi:hypothetical protein